MLKMIKDLHELERMLGIQEGFLYSLLDEANDWSFIIKLYSLVEASITMVLNEMMSSSVSIFFPGLNVDFSDSISKMSMGDKASGKLSYLWKCHVMNDRNIKQIKYLAKIRNNLAHKVQDVNFDLVQHYNALKINERKEFIDSIADYDILSTTDFFKSRKDNYEFTKTNKLLRLQMLLGYQMILTRSILFIKHFHESNKRFDEDRKTADRMNILGNLLLDNLRKKKQLHHA